MPGTRLLPHMVHLCKPHSEETARTCWWVAGMARVRCRNSLMAAMTTAVLECAKRSSRMFMTPNTCDATASSQPLPVPATAGLSFGDSGRSWRRLNRGQTLPCFSVLGAVQLR